MFQRKLIAGAVAVAALGLSSIALANGGGYGAAPVAAAPAPAPMNDQSFYFGVGAGYADTHWDNIISSFSDQVTSPITGATLGTVSQSIKDNGFAGRLFAGYNFNRFLALEGGWTYLPKAKITDTFTPAAGSSASAQTLTTTIKNYAFDLDGKVSAPLAEGFSVFGKLGIGYLHSKASNNSFFSNGNSEDHVGPVFGAGVAYDITPNLVADLSWTRYSGKGKLTTPTFKYQPNPDVGLLSLAYKIPADI